MPTVPRAVVPESVPLAALNATPPGNVPVIARVGAGVPDVVSVKVPDWVTVNVAAFALELGSVNWMSTAIAFG
mgnify:CR=1 FL=1